MKKVITIGIDEVGRGSLAGPVVLAAVALRGRMRWRHPKFGKIRDSKKLTSKRREAWFRYLRAHPAIVTAVARVSPGVIDKINIARAANLAAHRLVKRLGVEGPFFTWLDGGLALPEGMPHRALVKGDERKPIIAAASIIAKVSRDRSMTRLGARYPRYGFHQHKGYGSLDHRRMLLRYGPSDVHRRSFISHLV